MAITRPEPAVLHLDSGAAGRQSQATLAAVAAHARLEATTGAYVAQQQAAAVLDGVRRDVAGLLGVAADNVAFLESATAALDVLLRAWPYEDGHRAGVLAVEWGPNLAALQARGYELVLLPADGDGALDLDAFERRLASDPPDVVHLTQVTSHRGLVQPVAQAAAACRRAGVPLIVDAAQAIGHVATDTGADALYATSRKWLAGPRGVGMLAVADPSTLRIRPAPMSEPDAAPLSHVESHEAHVAGRIGLASAVREYLSEGPAGVHAQLAEVGRRTRAAIEGVAGWAAIGSASAITALRPLDGQDVVATRARLLDEHRILTTACSTQRAPRDMDGPLLRISPHTDVLDSDLERLASALS